MMRYMKNGFKDTLSQSFLLLVLWLYHFTWGFLLLMLVKSVVVPLMHRYPGEHLSAAASQLFLAESQFRLMKTDISHPYIWLLVGVAAARMLLTPVLNAGVYYSLANPHLNAGYRFLQGIKRLSGSFFLYYVLQMAITLAPVYWLFPVVKKAFAQHADYASLSLALLPWAAGYAAFGFLIRLLFMFVQFGRTTESGLGSSLGLFVRKLPAIVLLACLLLALSGAFTAAALSASLIWAGLTALIVQQLLHITDMVFKLWTIASQYRIYAD
ncbi:hypothetical protein [Paenibacillus oceani]|uniref:Uncharacterized protein n=1 Tax=Paenibacillus oceani TaxID=2772510 RepID=A0A927GXC7_9BACL|nr:hypothetical protein [Paenibacillus oceani]MBD2860390.1 hypothetical protein [Paenibacillus oceani]